MIELKIELDKIDKSKIFTSEKTGKKYLDITISKRQSPDNYGNTHTVYHKTKSKEETKVYIGTGVGKFEDAANAPAQSTPTAGNYNPSPENDPLSDLPFFHNTPKPIL